MPAWLIFLSLGFAVVDSADLTLWNGKHQDEHADDDDDDDCDDYDDGPGSDAALMLLPLSSQIFCGCCHNSRHHSKPSTL